MEILKKERIEYFDYCKGLLIILVVLGHVMPEDAIVHIYLYSWHMPAFFLINGMLLSYTNFSVRTLVGKRGIIRNGVIRLLIPYYAYGIFLLISKLHPIIIKSLHSHNILT